MQLVFTMWSSYGDVACLINGNPFIYHGVDAAHFPRIRRIAKRTPGKALLELKRLAYDYENLGKNKEVEK